MFISWHELTRFNASRSAFCSFIEKRNCVKKLCILFVINLKIIIVLGFDEAEYLFANLSKIIVFFHWRTPFHCYATTIELSMQFTIGTECKSALLSTRARELVTKHHNANTTLR